MTDLKLVALDNEDLAIMSAHMQDSVFKVGDIDWSPRDAQFALAANRFVWEGAERKRKGFERRRAALVFKRVLAVRSLGIDRGKRDEVLSLLALRFEQRARGRRARSSCRCPARPRLRSMSNASKSSWPISAAPGGFLKPRHR